MKALRGGLDQVSSRPETSGMRTPMSTLPSGRRGFGTPGPSIGQRLAVLGLTPVFGFGFVAPSIAFAQADAPPRNDPDRPVSLLMGGSTVVKLPSRIESVVVAHPDIADARPVAEDEVIVVGLKVGASDLVFRLENGETLTRRVTIAVDVDGLEQRLGQLFGVPLEVEDMGGSVAIRGAIPDLPTAEMIRSFLDGTGLTWVDLTRIDGVRQVQLRVRIAEASRTALRELAVGAVVGGSSAFGGIQSPGGTPFQPVSISPQPGLRADVSNANFGFDPSPVTSATTLFGGVPGANLEIYLQALSENRYVRVLAEPNLVAVSGEEATFLVGGEFPVPIVQGSVVGGGSTVTIEYKEFGVRLNFRPEVLGEGKIRLEVAPEVSELSQIGAVVQNGFTIPSVITRRSKTVVELGSGQSFAMAGLLRNKEQARISKVPVLGDLPILGLLFRSVRYEQDQTELVVMVTAELVEPLNDGQDRPGPGELHVTPNDWELFMEGKYSGAVNMANPLARLEALGLGGLRGPGAWRRPDEPRVPAGDAFPAPVASAEPAAAEPPPTESAQP
jgi:pilus assembly protein CpaC